MKISFFTFLLLFLKTTYLIAQVGVNNPNPQATLDVIGDVLVRKSLFLEDPGSFSEIRGSKLLIQKTDKKLVQYDIDESKYGPINYVQFVFRNTSTNGLQNYDTKISADDYLVTVQGFYFYLGNSTNTNVTLKSNKGQQYIEGFQFYAYINSTTNTWHLKGFVNDSVFMNGNSSSTIDLYMNLIIFRNGFIAKPLDDISVDMNREEIGIAPLPDGF